MSIVYMDQILNEVTNTVHKRTPGASAVETPCGVTYNVADDHLRRVSADNLVTTVTKCGRCFDDGGGY